MARKRPIVIAETVETLEAWLDAAKRGALQDVFIVGRLADGTFNDSWVVSEDMHDLLHEVRTAAIRARAECLREPH